MRTRKEAARDRSASEAPTTGLAARMERAKVRAVELSTATGEMNARFDVVEAKLVELSLGVAASVPLDDKDPQVIAPGIDLVFGKFGAAGDRQEWQLYLQFPNQRIPIKSASRQHRAMATERIPHLVMELLEAVDKNISLVQSATNNLDAVIAALATTVDEDDPLGLNTPDPLS